MNEKNIELQCEITIPMTPIKAFEQFTQRMHTWWPSAYTWSHSDLDWIGLDPKVGGRCTERSVDGFVVDFGRVLEVQMPTRLVFAWCIDPNRVPIPNAHAASTVEVHFKEEDHTTRVVLKHRHFERHEEGGQSYRDTMASEYGWPYLLGLYATSCEARPR